MATDPWRQWAAFAAYFGKAPPFAGIAPPPHAEAGFAPFADAERFAAAVRAFYQNSPTAQAAATQAFTDSLRDQFASVLSQAPSRPKDAPALGPAREHQERWQRAAAAWERLEEAQRRLQRLWSDVLTDAAGVFLSRMEIQGAPLTPEAIHRLYDSWIDCAEEAYARTAHGEPFCRALADAVNAASEWRAELLASLEVWAKLLDWPTRSEINSLTQRLRSLEKQVREKDRAPMPGAPGAPRRRARAKGKR